MLLFLDFYGQINRSKKAQDYDRQVNELTDTCKEAFIGYPSLRDIVFNATVRSNKSEGLVNL